MEDGEIFWNVCHQKGGSTNPLNVTDVPTCLDSDESFLAQKQQTTLINFGRVSSVILTKMNEQNLSALTMCIPRVLQYPERKPKPVPLAPHILIPQRDCQPENYQISAAEEDQTSVSTATLLPPERALYDITRLPFLWSHCSNLKDPPPPSPKLLLQAFIPRYKTLAAQIITPPPSSLPRFRQI